MWRSLQPVRSRSFQLLVVGTLVAIAGCGSSSQTDGQAGSSMPAGDFRYRSPQDCFAAISTAALQRDYALLYDSATDETQTMLAGSMAIVASMMRQFGSFALAGGERAQQMQITLQQIDALLVAQQIDRQLLAQAQEAMLQGAARDPNVLMDIYRRITHGMHDGRSFFTQVMPLVQSMSQGQLQGPDQQLGGELEQIQVQGEWATATVRKPDGGLGTMYFKSTHDGWRFHFDPRDLAGSSSKMGATAPAAQRRRKASMVKSSGFEGVVPSSVARIRCKA